MTGGKLIETDIAAAKSLLEADGNFLILTRLKPPLQYTAAVPQNAHLGVYVDIETTGLNYRTDEIIEVALVPFYFSTEGELFASGQPLNMLQEPKAGLIPPEIMRITGISIDDVRGHVINWALVRDTIAPAVLIIAHNAAFDRPFLEMAEPMFATKAWACSIHDVDWPTEGFESTKLEYLAYKHGFFYDRHRAMSDCYAGLHLLHHQLTGSSVSALKKLLESARQVTCRIWAENAPFSQKDLLKGRGYKWNDGTDARPRAWYTDVPEAQYESELLWLRSDVYQYPDANPLVTRYNAFDRYSARV